MRVSVAAILAIFILTIACIDPLCCADGCDRVGMTAARTAQTGGDCPTCLAALVPRERSVVVRPDLAVEIRDLTASTLMSSFMAAVDHPPRSS